MLVPHVHSKMSEEQGRNTENQYLVAKTNIKLVVQKQFTYGKDGVSQRQVLYLWCLATIANIWGNMTNMFDHKICTANPPQSYPSHLYFFLFHRVYCKIIKYYNVQINTKLLHIFIPIGVVSCRMPMLPSIGHEHNSLFKYENDVKHML